MLRLVPFLAILVLVGPVAAGLAGAALPAFGYLPALGGTAFSLDPFRAVFAAPGIWTSIGLSLGVGLTSTAIAFLAVVLFVAGWQATRVFTVLTQMLSPLLAMPHAAAAFGLAFLIAPSGWLVRLASPWATGIARPPDLLIVNDPLGLAIVAGLALKEIPFLFLMTLAALPQTDARRLTEVTASFGYGRTAGWIVAVLPRLYPQIRLPIFAVIAFASSVVDVALILGPTTPAPLAVRLVTWMNDPDLAMRFQASAGALVQLATTACALLIWIAGERFLGRLAGPHLASGRRHANDGPLRAASAGVMVLVVIAVALGIVVLAVWSFAGYWRFPDALPGATTLANWARQVPGIFGPLETTVVIGIAATVIALALSLGALENEKRRGRVAGSRALTLLYLPLIVPQIAFLFGLQVLFIAAGLDATGAALVLSHLVFVMPYVFLSLADPWRAFDERYATVAKGLGSSPTGIFWRVRLPMLIPAVLTAAAVGFAVSVGQYLPTLLIGAGRWPTVTTEAVALAAGGDRRVIGVYALLQMVLPFLGFAVATLVPLLLFSRRRGLAA
ncbi:putative thiamine transport system permease protein [Rhodobium orientis]|uniref:ABC transporter permease n=1 Tax=Rhodobium orientis TaxID=34017 RepID=A0A327JM23_9HYPH|nr:ABC transporter permease subunit [Rhodobium orientis]MBB4302029.1 putative thiamine transport system permease protein [Rhodobium orientis]MBK5950266.1 ABC transporter permease [Rhodobium orientis]RAI27141.1 ABC transporter permease [Rhodobium orientis]